MLQKAREQVLRIAAQSTQCIAQVCVLKLQHRHIHPRFDDVFDGEKQENERIHGVVGQGASGNYNVYLEDRRVLGNHLISAFHCR